MDSPTKEHIMQLVTLYRTPKGLFRNLYIAEENRFGEYDPREGARVEFLEEVPALYDPETQRHFALNELDVD